MHVVNTFTKGADALFVSQYADPKVEGAGCGRNLECFQKSKLRRSQITTNVQEGFQVTVKKLVYSLFESSILSIMPFFLMGSSFA